VVPWSSSSGRPSSCPSPTRPRTWSGARKLNRAFGEFRRVLRPNGFGVVYQVLTGPRMSDAEAREFWESELSYGHSVRTADIESAGASVGLELRRRIDYASEWGEYAQERNGEGGRRLVHAARLLRNPPRYIDTFGEAAYQIMRSDCLWHVYQMIGKLHGAAFLFATPGEAPPRGRTAGPGQQPGASTREPRRASLRTIYAARRSACISQAACGRTFPVFQEALEVRQHRRPSG
jgi:hypothetical protein